MGLSAFSISEIADKLTVTGYHDSMPGAGTFKKEGNSYAFVAGEEIISDTLKAPALWRRLRCQNYSAKLVPQPQDAFACGLFTLNDAPIRSSTKSISEPAM